MTPAATVADVLDRLSGEGPLGLACSGGGDSLALLFLATDWARARGRHLHVLTVDHGLRVGSADEARFVADVATRLDWPCDILSWKHAQGGPGVQARARAARHDLLAGACRSAGIVTLLTAHTRDDQAETLALRLAAGGSWRSAAAMPVHGPSPAWPSGRELDLLRPCLTLSRAALRRVLQARGERWLDDPSNEDRRHARIRMRERLTDWSRHQPVNARLAGLAAQLRPFLDLERQTARNAARQCLTVQDWGGARIDLKVWRELAPVTRMMLLDALVPALSGASLTPARARLEALDAAVMAGTAITGSGVGVLAGQGRFATLIRDRGALLGRVDQARPDPWTFEPDGTRIFDGRYALAPSAEALDWSVMGDTYEGLADRAILDEVPGPARAGLLVARDGRAIVAIAGLMPDCRPGADGARAVDGSGIVPARALIAHRFCRRLLSPGASKWFDDSRAA